MCMKDTDLLIENNVQAILVFQKKLEGKAMSGSCDSALWCSQYTLLKGITTSFLEESLSCALVARLILSYLQLHRLPEAQT